MTLQVTEDLISTKHSPGTTFPHSNLNNHKNNNYSYYQNNTYQSSYHNQPRTMSHRSYIMTPTEGTLFHTEQEKMK